MEDYIIFSINIHCIVQNSHPFAYFREQSEETLEIFLRMRKGIVIFACCVAAVERWLVFASDGSGHRPKLLLFSKYP